MAARGGRPGRADPAAHVHPPGGARDGRAGAGSGRARRPTGRAGRRGDLSLDRAPDGPCPLLLARPRAGVRRARRRRCRRPAGLRASGEGPCAQPPALPARADDARHLLALGQRAGPARGGARRVLPVVRRASRRARRDVPRICGAQAFARGARSRRPAAVLAGARGRRRGRAEDVRRLRARPGRRVPGRQRPAGRHRQGAAPHPAGPDGRRRRLPGDLRLPCGECPPHPGLPRALPGGRDGDARAQLPLHRADPGHRQRRGAAGPPRLSEAPLDRPRGRPRARAGDAARRIRAGGRGLRPCDGGARGGHGPACTGGAVPHGPRLGPARARADAARASRS